ncbi:MAG TPA: VWA domain-containing protein [Candidatus Acidoferrales bacterium]|nr:VWA domain-containing protein [Candidatus Acidoferrales bacterium]
MRAPLAIFLAAQLAFAAQSPAPAPRSRQKPGVVRTTVNLVAIDVEVTDRSGKPVKGLAAGDFTLLEDGKPQKISTFVYEDVAGLERAGATAEPPIVVSVAGSPSTLDLGPVVRNRRMILLFFDLTSLHPDELLRARDAAVEFVDGRMTAADLVGVVVLGNRLGVLSDFTNDRRALRVALDRVAPGVDAQLADLASAAAQEGEASVAQDVGAAWTPDDTEFNVFNTDRKLEAMQDLAQLLQAIPGKKIVMQFTGGITQTGEENRTAVEATTDAANLADVSFYSVDARGLYTEIPGGDATQAAASGSSMFSGAAVLRQAQSREDSRDTLETLADDTGGRAFFDLGNLGKAFEQAQQDTAGYYLLGYTPSNTRPDGRWRAVQVKVNRPGVRLRFRTGYYGPKDYTHFTEEDREQQLLDALRSPTPVLELPIALEAAVFRLEDGQAFVPIDAKLPAATLQWAEKKGSHDDVFDFAAEVREAATGRPVAALQDTITVRLGAEHYQQFGRRALLYQGGVILAPGSYKLKFVARENETGRIGSFEQPLDVPAAATGRLGLSSLMLSSQLVPVEKTSEVQTRGLGAEARLAHSPLEVSGERIVPSVTNVFTSKQTLYVFFQAYLPPKTDPAALRAGLLFFRNGALASRSPLVTPAAFDPKTRTASFRVQLALDRLPQGGYTLEAVTVVAGTPYAAFGRAFLALVPPAPATAAAPPGR